MNEPCDITLIDRRDAVAVETSFANAGRFCPTSVSLGSPAQGAGVKRTFIPNWLKDTWLFKQDAVDDQLPNKSHMRVQFSRPRLLYWGICNQ